LKTEAHRYWSYHIKDYLVSELCPLSSLPTAKRFRNRISFHPQVKWWGGAYTKPSFWAVVVFPKKKKKRAVNQNGVKKDIME
jgi:hypothetical protein